MPDTLTSNRDLHIVAADGDFRSKLDETAAHPFLVDERASNKSAALHYYRRLRLFTQANAGALDIASLDELLLADEPAASPGVLALAESTNFDGTHRAIANLRHAADFSPADLRQLVWAAEHNNQVSWILGDSDVHTFYQNIVRTFDERLAPSDLSLLNRLLSEAEPSDE